LDTLNVEKKGFPETKGLKVKNWYTIKVSRSHNFRKPRRKKEKNKVVAGKPHKYRNSQR
jgi:hypothetical protein